MKNKIGILGSLVIVAVVMTVPKAFIEKYNKKTYFSEFIRETGLLTKELSEQGDRVQGLLDALQGKQSEAEVMNEEAFLATMTIYESLQYVALGNDMLLTIVDDLHFKAMDAPEHEGDFCVKNSLLWTFPGNIPDSCTRIKDQMQLLNASGNNEYFEAASSVITFCDSLFRTWPPMIIKHAQQYDDCRKQPVSLYISSSSDDFDKIFVEALAQAEVLRLAALEVRERSRWQALEGEKRRRLVMRAVVSIFRAFQALAEKDKLINRDRRGEHAVARLGQLEENRVLNMNSLAVCLMQLRLAAFASGAKEREILNAALAPLEIAWKKLENLEKQLPS